VSFVGRPLRAAVRVFIIGPVAELGGAERVLLDFISSVKAIDPDTSFHIVLFSDGPLSAAVKRLGGTVTILPFPKQLHAIGEAASVNSGWSFASRALSAFLRSGRSLIAFLVALRSEIKRYAPDLIHTNGIKAHIIACLVAPSHIPIVWHMHDFIGGRRLSRALLRHTSCRVTAVVAISKAVACDIRSNLPDVWVVTIPNALDTEEFSPAEGEPERLDCLAGFHAVLPGTIRIGLVATYARWKGQHVFLRAAARLNDLLPTRQFRYYIVGGPIYATRSSQFASNELKASIVELGLERCAGLVAFQGDVVPILRSLDIVVHASTEPEPFGRTILEAMACGRSIVASNGGGAAELVEDGRTGLLHTSGDPIELADKLAILVRDPELRADLGRRARCRAVSSYSRERLGPALLSLYRSILESDGI